MIKHKNSDLAITFINISKTQIRILLYDIYYPVRL